MREPPGDQCGAAGKSPGAQAWMIGGPTPAGSDEQLVSAGAILAGLRDGRLSKAATCFRVRMLLDGWIPRRFAGAVRAKAGTREQAAESAALPAAGRLRRSCTPGHGATDVSATCQGSSTSPNAREGCFSARQHRCEARRVRQRRASRSSCVPWRAVRQVHRGGRAAPPHSDGGTPVNVEDRARPIK